MVIICLLNPGEAKHGERASKKAYVRKGEQCERCRDCEVTIQQIACALHVHQCRHVGVWSNKRSSLAAIVSSTNMAGTSTSLPFGSLGIDCKPSIG